VRITLSFDNGPIPGSTERILDVLKARGLRASFFALGKLAAVPEGRRLLQRAKDEGHWIGNHTMNHGTPLGETGDPEHVEHEIVAAERVLGGLALPERLFRPNGGGRLGEHLLSDAARTWLIAHKYTVVTWNNVPGDWIEPRRGWVERASLLARCSRPCRIAVGARCAWLRVVAGRRVSAMLSGSFSTSRARARFSMRRRKPRSSRAVIRR